MTGLVIYTSSEAAETRKYRRCRFGLFNSKLNSSEEATAPRSNICSAGPLDNCDNNRDQTTIPGQSVANQMGFSLKVLSQ